MELNKKKYTQKEVKELLEANSFEYKSKIDGLSDRIQELIDDNKSLLEKIEYYKNKESIITETLENVSKTSNEKKEETELSYQLEVESLRNFSSKWGSYFNALKEKYPLYPVIKEATDLKDKLDELLKLKDNKRIVTELNKEILENTNFNPKQKINDYIACSKTGEFNLEEVLNPGELHLEDLCKELGLIEEKE